MCLQKEKKSDGLNLNDTNESHQGCSDESVVCTSVRLRDVNLYCESGKIKSSTSIVCDSFTSDEDAVGTLNCFYGELPLSTASFIPTTERSIPETTEKPKEDTSFFGGIKNFFMNSLWKLNLISNSNETVLEDVTEKFLVKDENLWLPEALPITL